MFICTEQEGKGEDTKKGGVVGERRRVRLQDKRGRRGEERRERQGSKEGSGITLKRQRLDLRGWIMPGSYLSSTFHWD